MEDRWYVTDGKQAAGPFSEATVVAEVRKGLRYFLVRRRDDEPWGDPMAHPPFAEALRDLFGTRMPKPKRPEEPCRRCNGLVLIRTLAMDIASNNRFDAYGNPRLEPTLVPMAAAYDNGRPAGQLEMYVCEACGFVEWYCLSPQSIGTGPNHVTERIVVKKKAYR